MHSKTTYKSFKKMHERCKGKIEKHRIHYLDKGITVCERWMRYENFLLDMGVKPDGLTLERIDNSKGYSPDNCKWATWYEQAQNRSVTVWITCNGKTLCVSEWSRITGIKRATISKRLSLGWSDEDSVTIKVRTRLRKNT
jgi:hypothetical protein